MAKKKTGNTFLSTQTVKSYSSEAKKKADEIKKSASSNATKSTTVNKGTTSKAQDSGYQKRTTERRNQEYLTSKKDTKTPSKNTQASVQKNLQSKYGENKVNSTDTIKNLTEGTLKQIAGGHLKSIGTTTNEVDFERDKLNSAYTRGKIDKDTYKQNIEALNKSGKAKMYDTNKQKATNKEGLSGKLMNKTESFYDYLAKKGTELNEAGDKQVEKANKNLNTFEKIASGAYTSGIGMATDMLAGPMWGASMMSRTFGNELGSAKKQGADTVQDVQNAGLQAAKEWGSELIFGGIAAPMKIAGKGMGYTEKLLDKAVSKITNQTAKNAVYSIGKRLASSLEEGAEEVIAGLVEPIIQNKTYADELGIHQDIKASDIMEAVASAGLMTAVMGAGSAAMVRVNKEYTKASVDFLGGEKELAKIASNVDDPTMSSRAEANYQRLEGGNTLADEQVSEMLSAVVEQADITRNELVASRQAVYNQVTKEDGNFVLPVNAVERYNLDGSPVLREGPTAEAHDEYMAEAMDKIASLTSDEAQAVATSISNIRTGIATVSDVQSFSVTEPESRAAFEEATGLKLPVIYNKNGTVNSSMTNYATRQFLIKQSMESAREMAERETANFVDTQRGAVNSDVMQGLGTSGASAFHNYMDGQSSLDSKQYYIQALAFRDAYNAARTGAMSLDQFLKIDNPFKQGLDELIKSAYESGEADRNAFNDVIIKGGKKIADTKGLEKTDAGIDMSNVKEENYSMLKESDREVFEDIARMFNLKIVFFDDAPGKNGFYDNGVVYLNINNEQRDRDIDMVFRHEFTHHIRTYAPVQYKELEDLVRQRWYKGDSDAYAKAIQGRIDLYAKHEDTEGNTIELTEEGAVEELIADISGELDMSLEDIRDLAATKPSLFQAILDALRNIITKIRLMLGRSNGYAYKYNRKILERLDIYNEYERLFTIAAREAYANRAKVGLISSGWKGSLAKSEYERRERNINLRNSDNRDVLTEKYGEDRATEIADILETITKMRHEIHSSDSMFVAESAAGEEQFNFLENINGELFSLNLTGINLPPDLDQVPNSDDVSDYAEENDISFDEAYNELYGTFADAKEEINKAIEGWLQEFDNANGTNYAPTGAWRYSITETEYNQFRQERTNTYNDILKGTENGMYNPKEFDMWYDFYSKWQTGECNKDNFFYNTMCDFKSVSRRPNRKPDFVSYSKDGNVSSEYWYTDKGVVRGSKHWGKDIASCDWAIDGKHKESLATNMSKTYGYADWSDFAFKTFEKEIDGKYYLVNFDNTIGKGDVATGANISPEAKQGVSDFVIDNMGVGTKFSISTFNNDYAKFEKYTKSNGFSGIGEVISGKELLYRTLTQREINPLNDKAARRIVSFLSTTADELSSKALHAKFAYINWENLDTEVKVRRDEDGNILSIVGTAMVANGEYVFNFDFTTICNKREGMMEIIKALAQAQTEDGTSYLDEISLSRENIWKMNLALKEHNVDTACLGCFVESRRYNTENFIKKVDSVWNEAVKKRRKELGLPEEEYFDFSTKKPSDKDVSEAVSLWESYEADKATGGKSSPANRVATLLQYADKDSGYLKLIKPSDILTPEGIAGLEKISVSRGQNGAKLSSEHSLVKTLKSIYGTAAPKEILAFTPYNSEISLLPEKYGSEDMREYLKSIGGLRMQSFSDFKIENMFDYMQMVADLAARQFTAHGYTKVIDFARIFGKTGIKINLSVMFDVHSHKEWADMLGCDDTTAKAIAKKYAGLTFVESIPEEDLLRIKENKQTRPYKRVTDFEGTGKDGYLVYLVGDDHRAQLFYEETKKTILEGGQYTEEEAELLARSAMPFSQSINYNDAAELEDEDGYKENVGMIAVGYSDEHIKMLLEDKNVRYVIPYHKSGLPKEISEATNLGNARSYENLQNTIKVSRGLVADRDGNRKKLRSLFENYKKEHPGDKLVAIHFIDEYINSGDYTTRLPVVKEDEAENTEKKIKGTIPGTGDFDVYESLERHANEKYDGVMAVAEEYAEYCLTNNMLPIFFNHIGSEGYYKFLFDFAVTDADGNIYRQNAVRNNYPGVDVDAIAQQRDFTKGDIKELFNIAENALAMQNAKNKNLAVNKNAILQDLTTKGSARSIVDDTNLRPIIDGTPDYTNPKNPAPLPVPDGARASLTEQDAAYFDAIERDDMGTVQRMVDDAAKRAGYNLVAYHGTTRGGFTVFNTENGLNNNMGSHFGSKEVAEGFASGEFGSNSKGNSQVYKVYLKSQNPYETYDWFGQDDYYPAAVAKELADEIGTPEAYAILEQIKGISPNIERIVDNPDEVEEGYIRNDVDREFPDISGTEARRITDERQAILYGGIRNLLELGGYDSIQYENGLEIVGDIDTTIQRPEQIKSADPITYDDNGNIIPLSQRFNSGNEDIRYSVADAISKYPDDPKMENWHQETGNATSIKAMLRNADIKFSISQMNVLVACEESQAVCKELRKLGHNAYSCDIQAQSGGHPEWHIKGDVSALLNGNCDYTLEDGTTGRQEGKWDMIIAFPPCTHLATSGAKHFEQKRADGRQREAIEFFCSFFDADCDKLVIENPVNIIGGEYMKKWYPDIYERYNKDNQLQLGQSVQPWMFGDNVNKRTCLWLRGVPELVPAVTQEPQEVRDNKDANGFSNWYNANRGKGRSKTFPGVANAMANTFAGDARFSVTERDADGNELSADQSQFFAQSQARNDDGELVPVYHTTSTGGFTVFDPYESDDHRSLFFSDSYDVSQTYASNSFKPIEYAEGARGYYKCYLNITNPMVVDAGGANWNNIRPETIGYAYISYAEIIEMVDWDNLNNPNAYYLNTAGRNGNGDLVYATEKWFGSEEEAIEGLKQTYGVDIDISQYDDSETAYVLEVQDVPLDENGKLMDKEDFPLGVNTRFLAEYAYGDFDGVIIKNVADLGGQRKLPDDVSPFSTIYIVFAPEQIKSVDNENPTDNPDIRFSVVDKDMMEAFINERAESIDGVEGDEAELNELRQNRSDFLTELYAAADAIVKKQTQLTNGTILDEKSVKADVQRLLEYAMQNSEYTGKYKNSLKKEIVEALKVMHKAIVDKDAKKAGDIAYQMSAHIVDSIELTDDYKYNASRDLREYLRNMPIAVSGEDKADIDWPYFKKHNFGRMRLTQDGHGIDTLWNEILPMLREIANTKEYDIEDMNSTADMLNCLSDALDRSLPAAVVRSSSETTQLMSDIANDLYDIAYDAESWKSFADKKKAQYDEKTKRLKERQKEAIRELRNNYNKKLNDTIRDERLAKARAVNREKARGQKRLIDYKQKVKNAAERKKYFQEKARQHKGIARNYDMLVKMLLEPNTKTMKLIPEPFRKSVASLLVQLDLQTKKSKKLEETYGISAKTYKAGDIRRALKDIADSDGTDFFRDEGYCEYISSLADFIDKQIDWSKVRDMDIQTMSKLNDFLASLIHAFNNYNKTFASEKQQEIGDIATTIVSEADEQQKLMGSRKEYSGGILGFGDKFLNESMTTPIDLFENMGSGWLETYMGIRRGLNKHTLNMDYLRKAFAQMFSQYANEKKPGSDIESWRDEYNEYTLQDGSKITLTAAQIMSLYCHSKRVQSMGHIDVGGVTVSQIESSSTSKVKDKVIGARMITQSQATKISRADIDTLVASLTDEQKAIADALQKMLNTTIADWGNETSMAMYGIKLFREQNYFPITVSRMEIDSKVDDAVPEPAEKIRNFGFTKPLKPNASQALVLDDIFRVVCDHCNKMSLYNAYAMPIADFQRVFNYRERNDIGEITLNVKGKTNAVYGNQTISYIMKMMADINGSTATYTSGIESIMDKSLALYKKAAIGANLRVFVQQPTAIVRAFNVIDTKYFVKGGLASLKDKNRMLEHCPIAMWKDWGNYQNDYNRELEDIMMNKDWTKLEVATMRPYGFADNMTWACIYKAVEAEIQDKHPGVQFESEEYWKLVNDRMDYVIDHTQVVDSILHRSEIMRSKDRASKVFSSFMAEPTRTFNMLRSDFIKTVRLAKQGDRQAAVKLFSRTLAVYFVNAAAVSAMAALVDGLRDDDDDQTYWEKVWEHLVENFIDNINPLNLIAFVKDISNAFIDKLNGNYFQSNNMFIDGFVRLADITKDLMKVVTGENEKSTYKILYEISDAFSMLTGVPAKNIMRAGKNIFKLIGVDVDAATTIEEEETVFTKIFGRGSNVSKTFDELLSKANKKAKGKTGTAKNDAIWDAVTEGYTNAIEDGDMVTLRAMRSAIESAGGDVSEFDEKVGKKIATQFKKSIGEDSYTVYQLKDGLKMCGYDDEMISDLCYKSNTAQELKACFMVRDTDHAVEKLRQLFDAGLTEEDVYSLYENRSKGTSQVKMKYLKELTGSSSSGYVWPTTGTVTDGYGYRSQPCSGASTYHEGLDIAASRGTQVSAAKDGTVVSAGYNGSFGYQVVVDHGDGDVTYYSHLYSYSVLPGDHVSQGQRLGGVGSTGTSTGNHLDFRVQRNGEYIDPLAILR